MRHLGTKTIETKRLVLRRFTIDDAAAMYDNWARDPEVTKFLTWPPHSCPEISQRVLQDWVDQYDLDDFYQWAIVFKENDNAPIGSISVVHKNDKTNTIEIGYCIGRQWWRRGITSEALSALIKFFIEEVGVNRIEAHHDTRNPNSGKVMMKCGMKYEGTMRAADWNNLGICDYCQYALLACDHIKAVQST